MQWLIDLIIEAIGIPPTYVDRGDTFPEDFSTVDLVTDGAFHELDLSAIVPAGAVLVLIHCGFSGTSAPANAAFRKPGYITGWNVAAVTLLVAGLARRPDVIVPLSPDRKIEYKFAGPGWTAQDMTIRGWWL